MLSCLLLDKVLFAFHISGWLRVYVSDLRMADEGQVDCQRWTDGGGRSLLNGEVSVGRGAGENLIVDFFFWDTLYVHVNRKRSMTILECW